MADVEGTFGVRRLYEIITVVANESLNVGEALQRGLTHVCRSMGWPVGHALLVEDGRLEPTGIWFLDDPDEFAVFREVTGTVTFEIGRGSGPLRATAARREPMWLVDVTAEPDFQRARLAEDIGVRGALVIPVLVGDETVAVLEFYASDPLEPDRDVLEVMRYVGIQLGRVFERHRVREAERRTLDVERRYLRIAAHEMTAPLATATGYVELLEGGDLEPDERDQALRSIQRALGSLKRVTTNFLIDARLHAGNIRAHTQPCSAAQVVRNAISDVPSLAAFTENRCPDGLSVQADAFLLRQVVVNLLTNAERYGEPPVVVDCRRTGDLVEITISDRGPGVDDRFVPLLFERFTKATDGGSGTGLGLEIVAGLVALQGGTVRYEPNEPRGARFTIAMPTPVRRSDDRSSSGRARADEQRRTG